MSAVVAVQLPLREVPLGAAQQELASGTDRFELASVRPRGEFTFERPLITVFPGGRFQGVNVSVRDLVTYGYGLARFDVVEGGPSWGATERFDILAQATPDIDAAPPGTIGPIHHMVQDLLRERFNLVVRHEKRFQAGYALVVARSNGELGPQLRPSTRDCLAEQEARIQRLLDGGSPEAPENRSGNCVMRTSNGRTQAAGHTMSQFATLMLSPMLRAPVIDRTGLSGPFTIEMQATPPVVPPTIQAQDLADSGRFGPPLEIALREQLGLKLERTQVEVRVVVIDRLDRPTEN